MLHIEPSEKVEQPNSRGKLLIVEINVFKHHLFNFFHFLESELNRKTLLMLPEVEGKLTGMKHGQQHLIDPPFPVSRSISIALNSIVDFDINKILV